MWLSLSDLIALRLFGEAATGVSMASATGIFDIRTCGWDTELLRFLKIKPANLPEIVSDDAQTLQLNSKFVKRWPRLKSSLWLSAIGDGAANNIGAGCVTKTKAALMIGTSGAMRVAYKGSPPDKIPNGLWCYRIDRRHVIIGGALSDGGGFTAGSKTICGCLPTTTRLRLRSQNANLTLTASCSCHFSPASGALAITNRPPDRS